MQLCFGSLNFFQLSSFDIKTYHINRAKSFLFPIFLLNIKSENATPCWGSKIVSLRQCLILTFRINILTGLEISCFRIFCLNVKSEKYNSALGLSKFVSTFLTLTFRINIITGSSVLRLKVKSEKCNSVLLGSLSFPASSSSCVRTSRHQMPRKH